MRPRDDWMEVRRQPQFSSEDDFDEEEGLSEDEELAMYNSQRNYDRVWFRISSRNQHQLFRVIKISTRMTSLCLVLFNLVSIEPVKL